ncbi:hypothetical protein COU36_04765 [Candidatus Micrarchaeota archaeon CG10_big_fil_rev_8_21_14_0_10_59_7]|nr:MAG: hypothetical protein COU36_04765 [Candidatus Micrarchaeota archaeon CG10_big_fil_rev_8_21_14_0_10_59_7]
MPDADYSKFRAAVLKILEAQKNKATKREQLRIVREDKSLSEAHVRILNEAISGGMVRAESMYLQHVMLGDKAGKKEPFRRSKR